MAATVETISKGPKVTRHAWKDLGTHYKKVKEVHLRQLFADDPKRGVRMTAEAVGLFLDYSKNRIAETRRGIPPAGTNRRHVYRAENQYH